MFNVRHECSLACTQCDKTVKSRRKLMKHYYRAHNTLYCVLCQKTFSSLSQYREHVKQETSLLQSVCILCRSHSYKKENISKKMKIFLKKLKYF